MRSTLGRVAETPLTVSRWAGRQGQRMLRRIKRRASGADAAGGGAAVARRASTPADAGAPPGPQLPRRPPSRAASTASLDEAAASASAAAALADVPPPPASPPPPPGGLARRARRAPAPREETEDDEEEEEEELQHNLQQNLQPHHENQQLRKLKAFAETLRRHLSPRSRAAARPPPADISRFCRPLTPQRTADVRRWRALAGMASDVYYADTNRFEPKWLSARYGQRMVVSSWELDRSLLSPRNPANVTRAALEAGDGMAAEPAARHPPEGEGPKQPAADLLGAVAGAVAPLVGALAGSEPIDDDASSAAAAAAAADPAPDDSDVPVAWYVSDAEDGRTRYFTIQGSAGVDVWKANLRFTPASFEGLPGVFVHAGHYRLAQRLYALFLPLVREHLASGADRRLVFTGHSLGGSVGTMIALLLVRRGVLAPDRVHEVVT